MLTLIRDSIKGLRRAFFMTGITLYLLVGLLAFLGACSDAPTKPSRVEKPIVKTPDPDPNGIHRIVKLPRNIPRPRE